MPLGAKAIDAATGEKLWNFYLGVGAMAPPASYRIHGVQYVAAAAIIRESRRQSAVPSMAA